MKDKHLASPSQLSSSSKVRSMTFDISEAEQTQSPLINDTILGSTEIEKEVATQTFFTSAAEVSQDEEQNMENCELEDVNEIEKEESVEKEKNESDEAQGGQDIVVSEHAQEELKTNRETDEIESGLTHQEKALEEDQLEDKPTDNGNTNAEQMLDNSWTHTEPETSKVQLEDDPQDRDKEQDPEDQHIEITESFKSEGDPIHLKTSAGSKEVEEEETVLSSSTTFDAKLVPEEPTMEETVSFIPVEDVDPILSEDVKGSSTKALNADIVGSKLDVLDILRPVESDFTVFHDKEQTMKSKVKARKTSGRGSGTPSQREHEFQKENLKLSTENLELRFQLEQANKDLPRLKDQVSDLKEMCSVLKKEKAEVEKRLSHIRGSGRSGKTVPELEKTIALMKKVVEKVQRENESLKKTSEANVREQLTKLEQDHVKLKSEYEKLKGKQEEQLNARLESKTKGIEKIMMENERLRKDIKKEAEAVEKLRVAKASLEVTNEKLKAELEETNQSLLLAQSKGSSLDGGDSKTWKSSVVTRLFEKKMKGLESEIAKKSSSISELKVQLKEANEKQHATQITVNQLQEQVELLKNIPVESTTDKGLAREFQSVRLANKQLEREKAQLLRQIQRYDEQLGTSKVGPGFNELQEQIKAANTEKKKLQDEVRKLTQELKSFDPTFFEELEDLKFNYNEEVKKNIILEEQLKKLSDQFGVAIPVNVSIS
ncbi:unnamed protein product [Leuciscus chuanchicus]